MRKFPYPSIARVRSVAARLAVRASKSADVAGKPLKPMRRRSFSPRVRRMIAYDIETTNIAAGTPQPRYLTAHGAGFQLSLKTTTIESLAQAIETNFLCEEMKGVRFVAWNGNKFDGFIVAAALLHLKGYEILPYLAKGAGALRGFKVQRDGEKGYWEFLDGIAMCMPSQPVPLADFIEKFAPDFPKLKDAIDFDRESFDPDNAAHVAYAERDSEGLYHALIAVEKILVDTFGMPLQTTLGNAGIKIFQSEMPEGVNVWQPPFRIEMALREFAYRGGYCHHHRRYAGPTWKYDLNQAYAAAMRECDLPAGRVYAVTEFKPGLPGVYRVIAEKSDNAIPFYVKTSPLKGEYVTDRISDTWIVGLELEQLMAEGWRINIIEGAVWEDKFRMTEFVNKLEFLRMTAADGPSGALGTVCKNLGNSSYGKTCERIDGLEFRLAADCPEGFSRSIPGDGEDALPFLWYRIKKPILRPYHQPQIAAWITAHVRMVVRRAALQAPDAFIYADTDCVAFSHPVTLPLDKKVYGKWKLETDGEDYAFITKKVYFSRDDYRRAIEANGDAGRMSIEEFRRWWREERGDDFDLTARAKGMHVGKLTFDDFARWWGGAPPRQEQLQRGSFLKVMTGAEMFRNLEKVGQRIKA